MEGWPRPFGWQPDGVTEVPEEVELLRPGEGSILVRESRCARSPWISIAAACEGVTAGQWADGHSQPADIAANRAPLRPKDRTIVGRAVWEPIFPEDEWNRLRAILTDPSRNTRARRTPRTYLLTGGLLRCGLCGSPMYGRPAFAGRPFAYTGYRSPPGTPVAARSDMPVPQADNLVEDAVLAMLSSPDFAERRRRLVGTEPDRKAQLTS